MPGGIWLALSRGRPLLDLRADGQRPAPATRFVSAGRNKVDGILVVTDLDQFRVQRRDRAGGVIHEYHLVA